MKIAQLRLLNQHIARPLLDDPASVVRWFGAVQAQDYLGALWGVGLRTRGATEASVESAIARREIVRTWPMRGTLHFVAADDVRWMLNLLTPRVIAATAVRYRQLELDDKVLARAARVAERGLANGQQLQRGRLLELWESSGIVTRDARGLHILGHLSQKGLLCFGPRDGKQHTVTLLDAWLPPVPPMGREEALGSLALRYFTSHGPATIHDLAWWSGLTVTDARAGVESVKGQLAHDEIEGRTYWFAPARSRRGPMPAAHILPAWDEYTVAYRDRSAVLDPAQAKRVNAGGGVLKPVVVISGQVVGTWQRTLGKGEVSVRPAYFRRIAREDMRAVSTAAQRYGTFLGMPAEVR